MVEYCQRESQWLYCCTLSSWTRPVCLFVCVREILLAILFLRRSPVLVAMALREAGMNRQESIDFVRQHRRGSFNVRQLEFLQNYHSSHRLAAAKHMACLLM